MRVPVLSFEANSRLNTSMASDPTHGSSPCDTRGSIHAVINDPGRSAAILLGHEPVILYHGNNHE